MSILLLNITEISELLDNKELSAVDLTKAYVDVVNSTKDLNMFITDTTALALEKAEQYDNLWKTQPRKHKLEGIPISVKDIFMTKGIRTTNGSKFLENFIAPYESTVTSNLLEAGVTVIGKNNMDEFAMGSSSEHSYFGAVISPWKGTDNRKYVAGGSSGGSSAAVASLASIASIGTDTGGSIRQPASFTGTVGIKPTYGTCSRYGIISFASSLDQAGPITRTVEDNAILLQAMKGNNTHDSTVIKVEKDYKALIGKSIAGKKVAVPSGAVFDNLNPEINAAWNQSIEILKEAGAEIVNVEYTNLDLSIPLYYIISPSEAASNYARFDGIRYGNRTDTSNISNLLDVYSKSRAEGWGLEVKTRILAGNFNLLKENFDHYVKAAQLRRVITDEVTAILKEADVILQPTTSMLPFEVNSSGLDQMSMYLNDLFTTASNLTGHPAISVPISQSKNRLPIGIQMIGSYFCEDTLYQFASVLEKVCRQDKELSDVAKLYTK